METEALRAALRAAGDDFKNRRAALDQAKTQLAPLMLEGLKNPDIDQAEVVKLSGYTREHVRQFARENGIGPDRSRGRRAKGLRLPQPAPSTSRDTPDRPDAAELRSSARVTAPQHPDEPDEQEPQESR